MKLKIPKKVLQTLDYLIMFDPISLIMVGLVTLAGFAAQEAAVSNSPAWWVTGFDLNTFLSFAAVLLVSGGILILNQINHVENEDKPNQLSPIENGQIEPENAKKIAVIAMILGLGALLLIQKLLLAGFAVIITAIRAAGHNLLNISKKEKGVLWLLSNVVFTILLFGFGWQIKGSLNLATLKMFAPYLLEIVSLLTLIFLLDGNMLYKSYKDGEEIVHMGDRGHLIWLAAVLALGAFLWGLKLGDPMLTHSLLLGLVLYIILVFKVNHLWIVRTVSYTLFFFVFFSSSQYPWFFVFAVIAYYLSKNYYDQRYEIRFPNFGNIEETGEKNA